MAGSRFARNVFVGAGVWGIVVLTPLYWLVEVTGRRYTPPTNYPHFFYGFLSVAMVWQIAFLVIGSSPARFRPLMIPSVLEKLGHVATLAVLYSQARISAADVQAAGPELLLGILFIAAFAKTRPSDQRAGSRTRGCVRQRSGRGAAYRGDESMKMVDIPFGTTDWTDVRRTELPGETGTAIWRTQEFGSIRVRIVECTPGYRADHWCVKGHILYCLEGELRTELEDGRHFILTPGMSYQCADNEVPHRSSTVIGARLFIVD